MAQGNPPTVKDQILAERAALDQQRGIETAQSNLPTEYASGGIVAFDEGGGVDGGYSELGIPMITPSNMGDVATITPGTPEALLANKQITPAEFAKMKAATATPTTAQAPTAPGTSTLGKPRILDSVPAKQSGAPAVPVAPGLDSSYAKESGGIDDLIKQLAGDIKENGKSNADARKEAKLMAMMQAGLGIMGGTSPYAAANFKGAIPALQGYQEEMRGIRADEAKQLAQISALNLKGAELKQELKKLGITEEYYKAHAPLFAAQAAYYRSGKGSGSAGLGSIPFKEFRALKDEYNAYYANPKALMSSPFAQYFDKSTINGLKAAPGTDSYNSAMAAAKRIGEQHRQSIMQEGMQYSAKQRVASPVED
jgi:hypothetical protein